MFSQRMLQRSLTNQVSGTITRRLPSLLSVLETRVITLSWGVNANMNQHRG